MSNIFTDQTVVENTPLQIDGGNTNAVKVDGSAVTQPVSGSVSVSGSVTTNQGTPTTPTNSWPVEVTDGTNVLGTASHPLQTISAIASSSTVTQITSTGANQTLLSANANRKYTILFFASGNWSIKLGVGASATSFTYQVTSSNTTLNISGWAGQIDAFCTTSGKLVNVTELS